MKSDSDAEKPAETKTNLLKGRESRDTRVDNQIVAFINRNVTAYPTEVGGPKFEPIPVERQKDIMVNVARMHAQQEYDRIMELVKVLQKQANDLKRRLDITDMVHAAKYDFQTYHGQTYWLVYDHNKHCTRLSHQGPLDWTTGSPEGHEYICKVTWLGDHTWIEVGDNE